MGYWYAIGPVAQSTDAVDGTFYHAPAGCIGWIDTRPITPGAVASGFFAFSERPDHLKSTHAIVGDGSRLEEYYPNATERSAWETMYGVKTDASWTLVQTLRNLLFVDADPEGAARCLPGTPTHRGVLELHLGGHSRVWAERFTGRDHDAWPVLQRLQTANMARLIAEQTAEAVRIRAAKPTDDLGRRITEIVSKRGGGASYAEVREELAKAAEALPGKALTDVCRLYKCNPEDVLPLGVEVERRKPETAYRDDFNRANAELSVSGNATWGGSDQGWAWTKRSNDTYISSNRCKGSSASSQIYTAPAFSTYNHWAQVSFVPATTQGGPSCRLTASGDIDGYSAYYRSSDTTERVAYWSGGSITLINSNTRSNPNPTVIKIEADGSNVTTVFNGNASVYTNSANNYGYCAGFYLLNTSVYMDDFESEDLLAAAVVIPVPLLMLRA